MNYCIIFHKNNWKPIFAPPYPLFSERRKTWRCNVFYKQCRAQDQCTAGVTEGPRAMYPRCPGELMIAFHDVIIQLPQQLATLLWNSDCLPQETTHILTEGLGRKHYDVQLSARGLGSNVRVWIPTLPLSTVWLQGSDLISPHPDYTSGRMRTLSHRATAWIPWVDPVKHLEQHLAHSTCSKKAIFSHQYSWECSRYLNNACWIDTIT